MCSRSAIAYGAVVLRDWYSHSGVMPDARVASANGEVVARCHTGCRARDGRGLLLAHVGAAAAPGDNEPFAAEYVDGLADNDARHAIVGHEVGFGRELVTAPQLTIEDPSF